MQPLLLAIHRTSVGCEVAKPVIIKAIVQTNAHANFYVRNVATNTSPLIAPRMIANDHTSGCGAVRNADSPIAWSMDTPLDNMTMREKTMFSLIGDKYYPQGADHFEQNCTNPQTCQTCQVLHATALCRVHEQKPDKKRNALSVPVATNYNHVVTKTLSTEQQSIMGLIQRHQAPSINELRNQAFYGQ
ncbi:uncharacterized protein FSUBG_3297 [Fusarium subglutinans]|uniref:Uncharacterized protein n=1 Tax=Gibberella subglutinans TaxID=42677 RepID=A0A8H5V4J7_GIBSU|nr:uncharacterized protein FSUBG_3297 [Fusarium subglutinans]KAF5610381.1 hypothetical protein FSUBG_3297 [Fusarium subglutinans]